MRLGALILGHFRCSATKIFLEIGIHKSSFKGTMNSSYIKVESVGGEPAG